MVEAELLVDGKPLTLKRTYIEERTKPRGQTELLFKGNKTECYWNEVPVNVSEYQRRINTLFTHVKFRLFTYNISDTQKENPIETCELLIDGVPYAVANSASQVNAGLDVINALSRYYGVAAPIFIDNREQN